MKDHALFVKSAFFLSFAYGVECVQNILQILFMFPIQAKGIHLIGRRHKVSRPCTGRM